MDRVVALPSLPSSRDPPPPFSPSLFHTRRIFHLRRPFSTLHPIGAPFSFYGSQTARPRSAPPSLEIQGRRHDKDHPSPSVAKVSISSVALAVLLHHCAAAAGNCNGLLFGRASRLPAPPPSLSDYDDHAAAPPISALSISVSSHCSLSRPSSLSDPLGRFQPPSAPPASATVGFFSSRRRTTLRPSVHEIAIARSVSKSLAPTHPLLFLLVSPSFNPNHSTHSYGYRAFILSTQIDRCTLSKTVANTGVKILVAPTSLSS